MDRQKTQEVPEGVVPQALILIAIVVAVFALA